MTRYTITAIKSTGIRELAFDNNGRNNYKTEEEAEKMLNNVFKNNTPERIKQLIGKDLRIDAVECFAGGDSKKNYFDN